VQVGEEQDRRQVRPCRANAEAKYVTSGDASKRADALDKCESNFSKAWQKQEDKAQAAGAPCPGEDGAIGGQTVAFTSRVAAEVAGTRFDDNGDGTVTDHETGLQWEKKDSLGGGADAGNPHDADNVYSWSAGGGGFTAPDGTAFTDFLVRLNGVSPDGMTLTGCFAGHCDWRLPTILELAGIADLDAAGCGSGSPCIDPIFGPTVADHHWSATTDANLATNAWLISFLSGLVDLDPKSITTAYVRAVRGGS
jgi:hypothetical protein